MREVGLGQILFAVSFAFIGALCIGLHGFAQAWELLPKWLAAHDALVPFSGAILLAGGLALLVPRTARAASLALTVVLVLRLLLLHVPRVAAHPLIEVVWESMSENLIYIAGAWTIFSTLPRAGGAHANFGHVRAGQILFALALPAIGLSHFFYLNMTAPLIPSWLPFHVPLAYFTGAAWIAAALGILFGVLPNLAATLTAIMVSLFTLLIWVPAVIAAPTNVSDWSEICASTAITGAAWAVADSFRVQGQSRYRLWPRQGLTATRR
ncbi:MAG TPA: hypothetical protein VHY79_03200 [Rhizomicrobium sp.]|nr:hypothetical protein [Rhizomicrobium sp.]